LTGSQKPAHPPLETLVPIDISRADLKVQGFFDAIRVDGFAKTRSPAAGNVSTY
jgi:hypothetical protein